MVREKKEQEFQVELKGKILKRTVKDFRKLMHVLEKTNLGLYIPFLPETKANMDMPMVILEERLARINQVLITNYVKKLKTRRYILNS